MSDLEVRIATSAEAPVLGRLVAAFRDHLRATVPTDADLAARLPGALREPGLEFACAFRGGEAVGYSQVRLLPSIWAPGLEAHVEDLFVLPAARRQAVGRALLDHALARACERGATRATLTTNERNEAAQAFYRAGGWTQVSHALYPGGREVLWSKSIGSSGNDERASG